MLEYSHWSEGQYAKKETMAKGLKLSRVFNPPGEVQSSNSSKALEQGAIATCPSAALLSAS